jgi:hypothetical protein
MPEQPAANSAQKSNQGPAARLNPNGARISLIHPLYEAPAAEGYRGRPVTRHA